ncbi:hypothetical protein Elgi_26130 [Paenibacillus elgii]|uniref:hypothetical protein n=1 Tax=Paenibacillus elgii TaxID=189691 RepID=UPI002D7BEF8B|nr:hypothetical protein Elgi_26130 [Paenibacillus elgii]
MEALSVKYDHLLQEEETLVLRIKTCEECVLNLLQTIGGNADSLHLLTIEDMLSAVQQISYDLQTELLHLRMEKYILSHRLQVSHADGA